MPTPTAFSRRSDVGIRGTCADPPRPHGRRLGGGAARRRRRAHRLAAAIGRGGPLDALVARLTERQARREALEVELALAHSRCPRPMNRRRGPRTISPRRSRPTPTCSDGFGLLLHARRADSPNRAPPGPLTTDVPSHLLLMRLALKSLTLQRQHSPVSSQKVKQKGPPMENPRCSGWTSRSSL